jgi:hypothetical protein
MTDDIFHSCLHGSNYQIVDCEVFSTPSSTLHSKYSKTAHLSPTERMAHSTMRCSERYAPTSEPHKLKKALLAMSASTDPTQHARQRRQMMAKRTGPQSLFLLFPALAILWFHRHLSSFGVPTAEDFGLFPHAQSTSRQLSSQIKVYHPPENVTRPTAYASVPDAARKARQLPNLTQQVNNRAKYKDQRRRRTRGKMPRRGSTRDVTAWVRHPENITSFSYVPVGKYVNKTILYPQRSQRIRTANATSPYAYAFVMGGVNEEDGFYLGMLYNVLIAAYILEKEGSTADIVLYVQMSAESPSNELPADNTRLLEEVGVRIRYLPKPKVENFHQIIMQKMVVLDLVEYRRVLFLDTDVMPFCNLDYVFHLSDGPKQILKKNLIIALSGSPGMYKSRLFCFFMKQPTNPFFSSPCACFSLSQCRYVKENSLNVATTMNF